MKAPLMWICDMSADLRSAYPDIALNSGAAKHYDYKIGEIFK